VEVEMRIQRATKALHEAQHSNENAAT
jgi:hypothetical protein